MEIYSTFLLPYSPFFSRFSTEATFPSAASTTVSDTGDYILRHEKRRYKSSPPVGGLLLCLERDAEFEISSTR